MRDERDLSDDRAKSTLVALVLFFFGDDAFKLGEFSIEAKEIEENARPDDERDDENDVDGMLNEKLNHCGR